MPQTFPSVTISYGSSKGREYRTRRTTFGDGYEQRVADGIQNKRTTWDLIWENISDANADTIETFFDARAGHDAFTWTPPGGSATLWTCDGYTRDEVGPDSATVRAVFREVFDL